MIQFKPKPIMKSTENLIGSTIIEISGTRNSPARVNIHDRFRAARTLPRLLILNLQNKN